MWTLEGSQSTKIQEHSAKLHPDSWLSITTVKRFTQKFCLGRKSMKNEGRTRRPLWKKTKELRSDRYPLE